MQALELLRQNPHLARLPSELLDALDAAFVVSEYANNHVIARQDDQGGSIFLVVDGEVEVSHAHDGRLRTLARLGPGQFFGLVSLVDQGPRSATCTARGPSKIATLSSGAATLLFHAHAPLAHAFQRALASQLAADFRRIDARLRDLHEIRLSQI